MGQLSSGLLIEVSVIDRSTAVPSTPRELRAQAQVYFELARQMSLHADAAVFRATAEQYLARAAALEAHSAVIEPPSGE